MSQQAFPSWPNFTQEEADAVSKVLLSNRVNYWTGEECRTFEDEFARWCGCEHAIALANGTIALEIALKALEVGPGDEVIVTPRTFIASVSAVVQAGATPVFADVDPASGNITAETISHVLTERTKAAIVVHLGGWPADMGPIMDLASGWGFFVIEDCAQAHGARYRGQSVGTIGHVGAWSFCQDKIMTTGGEGGMITTNDRDLWARMWSLKDHGKNWEAVHDRAHPPGFRWVHDSFGTNGRMTEMQAAIGRIQLRRMAGWSDERRQNATWLKAVLEPFTGSRGALRTPYLGCTDPLIGSGDCCQHANYRFYAYVRPENLNDGWTRDRIVEEISARGIPCFQGSCPEVYLEHAFDGTLWRPAERLPVARNLGETSIMFLVHPGREHAHWDHIITGLDEVMGMASVGREVVIED